MTRHHTSAPDLTPQRQAALARWDSDGGAGPDGPQAPTEGGRAIASPNELSHLRARVIALENAVIALLSTASDRQLQLTRDMAAYITPRPGAVSHPLTITAAAQMLHLVERGQHFRAGPPSVDPTKALST
jgi:hypothetical protein